MKRLVVCFLACAVSLLTFWAMGEAVRDMPVMNDTQTEQEALPLTGRKIGIDPGHQQKGNSDKETVSPDSTETKAKVSSGTAGVSSGVAEYVVNLDISLQLKEALELLGAEVYMTRETNDVNISNQERAIMMNDLGVDLVLRVHCNGSTNNAKNGMGMYVRATGDKADECESLAKCLLAEMVSATGAANDGVHYSDTYTGLNWSTVPSVLVEMGFMSNPEEDLKLNDPEYQKLLVEGFVKGILRYLPLGE